MGETYRVEANLMPSRCTFLGRGRGEQQQVEVLGMRRCARDETGGSPALHRGLVRLGMGSAVVFGDDELLQDSVQLFQGEGRCGDRGAVGSVRDVAGQVRQELGGDGAIEALDLPASLRDARPGSG